MNDFPESQFRPLAKAWLMAMTDEEIPDVPPDLDPGIRYNDDSDLAARPEAPDATDNPAAQNSERSENKPTSGDPSGTPQPQN